MKLLFLVVASIPFISCNLVGKKKIKPEYNKWEETDSINKASGLRLAERSDAITGWDDSASFTYELQQKLEDTIVSIVGDISDIEKVDSFFVLKITGSKQSSYMVELKIDSLQLKELQDMLSKQDEFEHKGCFIFKAKKSKINLS